MSMSKDQKGKSVWLTGDFIRGLYNGYSEDLSVEDILRDRLGIGWGIGASRSANELKWPLAGLGVGDSRIFNKPKYPASMRRSIKTYAERTGTQYETRVLFNTIRVTRVR